MTTTDPDPEQDTPASAVRPGDLLAAVRWLIGKAFPSPVDPCNRCGHSQSDHRLDDALDLDPTDPATPFRCIWPMPDGPPVSLCDCPDYLP